MRNTEVRKFRINDEAAINALLSKARLEERRARAEAVAARMDSLAIRITSRQLSHAEAAELLREEAARYLNEAGEIH
ncbi:DUF2732 family protein [Jejubacter calystegiae]|uniref:DUF2732 family protein n=1 Tax=Jejubacter calystegiae TaxID=2579935 RepID=A0A4P8YFC4_9ENTR|nr:DUF2732 family protein [Jejubacter calystegiae]QCT18543.1 DUF2732 family protein [Jejubacter calystegiae]